MTENKKLILTIIICVLCGAAIGGGVVYFLSDKNSNKVEEKSKSNEEKNDNDKVTEEEKNDSKDTEEKPTNQNIVLTGTYSGKLQGNTNDLQYYIFKEDGTYTFIVANSEPGSGKYTVKDGVLTLKQNPTYGPCGEECAITIKFKISEDLQSFTSEENVTFRKNNNNTSNTNVTTNKKCNTVLNGTYYGEITDGDFSMQKTIVFKSDGTYTFSVVNSEPGSGKYTVKDGVLTLKQNPTYGPCGEECAVTITYTIDNDCNTITEKMDNYTIIYKKQ